jgi:hypothetical protein
MHCSLFRQSHVDTEVDFLFQDHVHVLSHLSLTVFPDRKNRTTATTPPSCPYRCNNVPPNAPHFPKHAILAKPPVHAMLPTKPSKISTPRPHIALLPRCSSAHKKDRRPVARSYRVYGSVDDCALPLCFQRSASEHIRM